MHVAVLWRVGPLLEYLWGSPRFLLVYLGGGIMGMLFEAAVQRVEFAHSEDTICAVQFGNVAILSMWALYLLTESSVQHKQQRSGSWLMCGLLLYSILLTGLTYLLPHTGNGLSALGAAVLFSPAMYIVAFNNLNTKQRITFGTHDEVWLRSEVGPGLHLLVPDGTRSFIRHARRQDPTRTEDDTGEQDNREQATATSAPQPPSEQQLTSPLVPAGRPTQRSSEELPRGRTSTRRWAQLMRSRHKAPLCADCVFVCPEAVRYCGCRRVWGLVTALAALLLLSCFVTFACIALGA